MVRAHQEAWAWQDEWVDLTMADIRRLESETQEYLRQCMAQNEEQGGGGVMPSITNIITTDDSSHTLTSATSSQIVDFNMIDKDKDTIDSHQFNAPKSKKNSISQYSLAPSNFSTLSKECSEEQAKQKSTHWSRSNSRTTLHSPGIVFNLQ